MHSDARLRSDNVRLLSAMKIWGLETAEDLARHCKIPLEDAELALSVSTTPRLISIFSRIAQALRHRMIWLTTGDSVPQVFGSFTKADLDVLTIAGALDKKALAVWIRTGMHLIKKNPD
jgi:hypothetical protein